MKDSCYPGYDVLEKWDTPSYNDQTREVLAKRMTEVPPRRFFSKSEFALLEAVCARVLPQPGREAPVPIAPFIDSDLHTRRGTGTRYASMPDSRKAWRQGLAAIEAEAQARHGCGFAALEGERQHMVLSAINQSDTAAPQSWEGLPPEDFFRKTLLKRIVTIYYAHPAAMSEIGYGGPASPRGYVRLGPNRADPWEAPLPEGERQR